MKTTLRARLSVIVVASILAVLGLVEPASGRDLQGDPPRQPYRNGVVERWQGVSKARGPAANLLPSAW